MESVEKLWGFFLKRKLSLFHLKEHQATTCKHTKTGNFNGVTIVYSGCTIFHYNYSYTVIYNAEFIFLYMCALTYYRLEFSFQKFSSTECLEILIWEESLTDCKLAIVLFVLSGLQIELSTIFSFRCIFRSLDVPFSGAVHVAALPYRFCELKRSRVLVAQYRRLTSNL